VARSVPIPGRERMQLLADASKRILLFWAVESAA